MLATLIAASLVSLESCSACSTEDRTVKLCEAHAAVERVAMSRESTRLASKEAAARIAALDALAALTEAHTNAPSRRVVERIASALDDEAFEVRSHAAGLLGRPQHALASLEALVDALAETKKEQASLNAEYDALSAKIEKGDLSDKRRADLRENREACEEHRTTLARWRHVLVDQLSTFPDDRAVSAILANTHRNLLTSHEDALVRLGNREAVRALAESIAACERNLAQVEREVADLKASAGAGQMTARVGLAIMALEKMQAQGARAREGLVALFAERGLVAPGASANAAAWSTWIEQNCQSFPVHLPGLSSPAW